MIRKIVSIDEERCTGCGLCAEACHEGAIEMVDGKAHLVRDDYCDGLGDCLPACPAGAISIAEREADPYSEAAVAANRASAGNAFAAAQLAGGLPTSGHAAPREAPAVAVAERPHVCPGSAARTISHDRDVAQRTPAASEADAAQPVPQDQRPQPASELVNWPVQLKLAPTKAPYFDGANLLIAADCCAYTYAAFHRDFIHNRVALIGCPKLDDVDYTEKLTRIISDNDVRSVTIARMEVPCCGGIEYFATEALKASGKFIPWQVVTISIDGRILD